MCAREELENVAKQMFMKLEGKHFIFASLSFFPATNMNETVEIFYFGALCDHDLIFTAIGSH